MLQAEHIPVVLSDWMMPGLDGLSLCRLIRGCNRLAVHLHHSTIRPRRTGRPDGGVAGRGRRLPGQAARRRGTGGPPRDCSAASSRSRNALERQNARLAELAITDDLTGLANRREFRRALEANLALAHRQGQFLSLVLFDIDHFKEFNDTFGHPAGDAALQTLAQNVRATCRGHEPVARLGGEEFGVILFGASREQARAVAERIRAALAGCRWTHRALTVSFGIATCGPGEASVARPGGAGGCRPLLLEARGS